MKIKRDNKRGGLLGRVKRGMRLYGGGSRLARKRYGVKKPYDEDPEPGPYKGKGRDGGKEKVRTYEEMWKEGRERLKGYLPFIQDFEDAYNNPNITAGMEQSKKGVKSARQQYKELKEAYEFAKSLIPAVDDREDKKKQDSYSPNYDDDSYFSGAGKVAKGVSSLFGTPWLGAVGDALLYSEPVYDMAVDYNQRVSNQPPNYMYRQQYN